MQRDETPDARPPMSRADALKTVEAVARQYTLISCACAACPAGVCASRAEDGLCPTCRATGCQPLLGLAPCRHPEDRRGGSSDG